MLSCYNVVLTATTGTLLRSCKCWHLSAMTLSLQSPGYSLHQRTWRQERKCRALLCFKICTAAAAAAAVACAKQFYSSLHKEAASCVRPDQTLKERCHLLSVRINSMQAVEQA